MINFNKVKLQPSEESAIPQQERQSVTEKDIAIIGISLQCAFAESPESYWDLLKNGTDCVRGFPQGRKQDTDYMLHSLGLYNGESYGEAAYLEGIDKFDYRFFRLSPKEASLMDPNQRLFLESAWSALEDAGYGGNRLAGSKTGIYVGFGADADYRRIIASTDPDSLPTSLAGNVRPILASRLSYIMDFHGPSLVVDTTCSSSLMAIHLASQAIRSGECQLAIAGGVQLHLLPIRQGNIGIESSDGRAKTFDDRSDGTGTGEGVFAVLLKPLRKAMRDGDSIYAVIKGSAANHDGASIGITAPNALAQEEVIVNAWMDGEVEPETIGYIETHGTGTKLGDPIEIDGLTRAFRRFTERKAFCAVGSVKTNIGHLDHAAGIAGFVKATLALHHKQIPPTLHFQRPNQKINFEESPIYINDRLQTWEDSGMPRRCGVSSFGLSGTNCHIVLEEAPEDTYASMSSDRNKKPISDAPHIFTISAVTTNSLIELLTKYNQWMMSKHHYELEDLCYTASTGRGHYQHRLAIVVGSNTELREKIARVLSNGIEHDPENGIYYGDHKMTQGSQRVKESVEWTGIDQDREALADICRLYVQGADIDWNRRFRFSNPMKIHLPTYAFEKTRCWLEYDRFYERKDKTGQLDHAMLIDRCLASSISVDIYTTVFHAQRQWVLSEHKIAGESVLVGTAYIEMVLEACRKYWTSGMSAEFQDLIFMNPLTVKEGESYEVQLTVRRKSNIFSFDIAGRLLPPNMAVLQDEAEWVKLAEGNITFEPIQKHSRLPLKAMLKEQGGDHIIPDFDHYNRTTIFEFGPRWKNISDIFMKDQELLSRIELPEWFKSEEQSFMAHPALMDNALATAPLLNKELQHLDQKDRIYLPFSYKKLTLYRTLPSILYSHVQLRQEIKEHAEIIAFDITLVDEQGERIGQIENYMLKRATKLNDEDVKTNNKLFYEVEWVNSPERKEQVAPAPNLLNKKMLVLHHDREDSRSVLDQLSKRGAQLIEAITGDTFARLSDTKLVFRNDFEGYIQLFDECRLSSDFMIIHMLTCEKNLAIASLDQLDERLNQGIHSLLHMSKALLHRRVDRANIVLVTRNSYRISGTEEQIQPENAAMIALGHVIRKEYKELLCRAIDIDHISWTGWIDDLLEQRTNHVMAYRDGLPYQAQFVHGHQGMGSEITIKADGVYVITGGLGGVGLALAVHLARKAPIKLALMGRGAFPEKGLWESILSENNDPALCQKISMLKSIELHGAEVQYFQADVSSTPELAQALNEIRDRYGSISGIIHCAGVAGDGFLIRKELSQFKEVIQPKIHGAWNLDHLTREDSLDFMIVCSSNTTLMGVPGQGDYTAANAYLDSFSGWRNAMGRRTMTVSWPAWKETGLAYRYGTNTDNIFRAISTEQALAAFDGALELGSERLIIGELLAEGKVHGYSIMEADVGLSHEVEAELKRNVRKKPVPDKAKLTNVPSIKGRTDYSKLEKHVEEIWKEVLGYEEIHSQDNFFEIGGDSILVTRMQSLINKYYPDTITVADLFTYNTVQDIVRYLEGKLNVAQDNRENYNNTKLIHEKVEEDEVSNFIEELLQQLEEGAVTLDEAVRVYVRSN